jgi:omega-hydroxy-beta-dihydromenaquinone-9 sulfotransferase
MWRKRLLIHCGPNLLSGITVRDWLRLLRENRFALDPRCLARAASISACAATNSVVKRYERLRYGRRLDEVEVLPPLFVLGHWRSGTTHLHNLLSCDDRFAAPSFFQTFWPHTFLSTEGPLAALPGFVLPKRRAYDNVRLSATMPCEDEFAMCVCGFRTPYLAKVFPRRAAHYDRFLTFRDATEREVADWKRAFLQFLRKLTLRHGGKPLVLKSPTHTGRLKLLMELFPGARFVHIHRDPYAVFKSTMNMWLSSLPFGRLQRSDGIDWAGRVLRQYREMYDAFFEHRRLAPPGVVHDVRFEDLERDPVGEVRKLYAALGLPDFAHMEPRLREYAAGLAGYRKNVYRELPPEQRDAVRTNWRRCFDAWGYPA